MSLTGSRDQLMAMAACLQLLPENATKWARFERLLEVASAIEPGATRRPVTARKLKQLLTTPPIATPHLLAGEDPFEEPFIPSIIFYGGNYRVVAGGASGAHAGCQLILDAVRRLPENPHEGFKAEVFAEAFVLLTFSELICQRAGLDRWTEPTHSQRAPLVVPAENDLHRLEGIVRFSNDDLSKHFGLEWSDRLGSLIIPGVLGIWDHDDETPTDDRSYLYPLALASDGSLLVTLPSGLSASITHRTISHAVQQGIVGDLVEAIRKAQLSSLRTAFDRVKWERIAGPTDLDPPSGFSEAFYRFDVDKIAHICSVVDPMDDYSPGQPFAHVDLAETQNELEARFISVRRRFRSDVEDLSLLHVVSMAPLGRSFSMGFTDRATDRTSALLLANLDDLDLMSHLEEPDPLGLWKFARASDRLHSASRVMSFSKLDEYAIYRDNGHGYYMSDEGRPTMLSVAAGTAGPLRATQRRRLDEHGVTLPGGDGVVRVKRWPADDASAVYRPEDSRYSALHLVEGALPVWIVPQAAREVERESSEDLAEAIAFWLWQCGDELGEALKTLETQFDAITIEVRMLEQATQAASDAGVNQHGDWLRCEPSTPGTVQLTLGESAASRLSGPDNSAEREIAMALVEAIFALAHCDPTSATASLQSRLESGPMKMFQVLGAADDGLLAIGHMPRPRLVSDADLEELLDDIGELMRTSLELPFGPLDPSTRTTTLNKIVQLLFTELLDTMAQLSSTPLLEFLAGELEAVIFSEARTRLQLPSQAACFGAESTAVKRATEAASALTSTAVANRFLIECATAVPPSGHRRLSISTYDRLLALAKQIIEYGYVSDAIQYGLSESRMSMLPAVRLGFDRAEPFQTALQAYQQAIRGRALGDAQRRYSDHWATPTSVDEGFDPSLIDAAYLAEFGVTAHELALLTSDLIEIARCSRRQIACVARTTLLSQLSTSLGWEEPKVGLALGLLTLGPLENFSARGVPPDSYPWRYSRDRSAIRRPLFVRPTTEGEAELIWGPRAVYRSGRYLLDQIVSGRLKVRSQEMHQFIASMCRQASDEFNHAVADLYRRPGDSDVRENVKRIGRTRLQRSNGQAIGDIDVLVVNRPKRVVAAIEVKDFEFARTPAELSNEVAKLLEGPDSAVSHHRERLDFLRQRLPQVLEDLGVAAPHGDWQVHGSIVTSGDLLAARFPAAEDLPGGMKLISFDELTALSADKLIERHPSPRVSNEQKRARRKRRKRQQRR